MQPPWCFRAATVKCCRADRPSRGTSPPDVSSAAGGARQGPYRPDRGAKSGGTQAHDDANIGRRPGGIDRCGQIAAPHGRCIGGAQTQIGTATPAGNMRAARKAGRPADRDVASYEQTSPEYSRVAQGLVVRVRRHARLAARCAGPALAKGGDSAHARVEEDKRAGRARWTVKLDLEQRAEFVRSGHVRLAGGSPHRGHPCAWTRHASAVGKAPWREDRRAGAMRDERERRVKRPYKLQMRVHRTRPRLV